MTTREFGKLLKSVNTKLEKVEKENKQLATLPGPKATKHNKSWSQYSAQYKSQQKRQIASDVCTALKFMEKS